MEPRDLSEETTLFVATDILTTAKELQEHLSHISYDEQPQVAAQALDVLGDPRELYGSRKLFIHALGARVLQDPINGLSFDEQFWHGTYLGDAYIKAEFSRFSFVRSRAISGICLNLMNVSILKSSSNPEFESEKITSGVYVPVHAAETVLVA